MENTRRKSPLLYVLAICLLAIGISFSNGFSQAKTEHACCEAHAEGESETLKMGEVTIPNVVLVDQNGKEVHLYDLIKNKVVAMNFIFTTCTTICPPMGANFAELNRRMAPVRGDNLAMISISIDPGNDTPERLKEWSGRFNGGPGWTLLTGETQAVFQFLKDLKVFTPLKEDHAPILLIGKEGEDNWIRTNGLADADLIESTVRKYLEVPEEKAVEEELSPTTGTIEGELTPGQQADLNYFTDTKLVDQTGTEYRLYSDLMKDKVVVINPFFAECTGSCPVMHKMMEEVQRWLGDKLGTEVIMLSFTVDPKNDTPEKLTAYAEQYGAKPGWYFLSGEVGNVELVTKKIGKYVEEREAHDNIILIGNLKTRLWKKANGMANPVDFIPVLQSVMNDQG